MRNDAGRHVSCAMLVAYPLHVSRGLVGADGR